MKHSLIRNSVVVAGTLCALAVGFPAPVSGSPPPIAAAASKVPLCTGNNFFGGWVGKNGATGTSIFEVAFVNDGHATCRLSGYPTIQGYRDGREYPLTAGHINSQAFDISPTDVAPRMSAEMFITTSALCNALNTGTRSSIQKEIAETTYTVSVRFPHSNYPIDIYGLNLTVACSLDVTQLGWR